MYSSLRAIIFLGTPHRGANESHLELASIARKIVKMSGFSANDKVIKDLKFDSTIGRVLQEDFVQLLDERRPNIFTFQEGKGLTGFAAVSGKVRQGYIRGFKRLTGIGRCRYLIKLGLRSRQNGLHWRQSHGYVQIHRF